MMSMSRFSDVGTVLTVGVKLYGFYLVLVSMFLTQDWHVMPENQDFRCYQYQVFLASPFILMIVVLKTSDMSSCTSERSCSCV